MLSAFARSHPTFHFRHGGQIKMVMADGAARARAPDRVVPLLDRCVGYLEPPGEEALLTLRK